MNSFYVLFNKYEFRIVRNFPVPKNCTKQGPPEYNTFFCPCLWRYNKQWIHNWIIELGSNLLLRFLHWDQSTTQPNFWQRSFQFLDLTNPGPNATFTLYVHFYRPALLSWTFWGASCTVCSFKTLAHCIIFIGML